MVDVLQPAKIRRLTGDTSRPQPPTLDEPATSLQDLLRDPRNIEETRIPKELISSLALKHLYFSGMMEGWQVAKAMHLNFMGVVEPVLLELRQQHLIEVTGGSNLNRASYQYLITDKGSQRARELLERNRYVGPCPVAMEHYVSLIRLQAQQRPKVRQEDVKQAMKGLVIAPELMDRIGPAVNSFRSMFLYGPPGNGKTTIAKAIARGLLPGTVMIPHALYESGQIILLYDSETHQQVKGKTDPLDDSRGRDKRWVRCKPPVVITGGELTLDDLNLAWSDTSRFYEAPLQLKANGGMFLIDDFGRQQMAPQDLLNRWIVPLEERLDFLTFHTGKKFAIPFETLIVFSTNLDPHQLFDEAFLRRIRHKLGILNPTKEQFYQIFLGLCKQRNIEFNEESFVHLMRHYYLNNERELKACHPRDLLDQLTDFATYQELPVEMSVDLIDRSARSYFGGLL